MLVKHWQIIIFVSIITTITIVIFPSKPQIINLLFESRMADDVRQYLSTYLNDYPNDTDMRLISAKLFRLEGNSLKAIEEINAIIDNNSENTGMLLLLSELYEQEREPKKIVSVLERLTLLKPTDWNTWDKLADYYKLLDNEEKESETIIKRICAEQIYNFDRKNKDVFLKLINDSLDLCTVHYRVEKNRNTNNLLLTGLFRIRQKYMRELIEDQKNDLQDAIFRSLETFVYTDHINLAVPFVKTLDKLNRNSIEMRLNLVEIIRWNGMDKDAIEILKQFYHEDSNQQFLFKIAQIASEIGELDVAIETYEKLEKSDRKTYKPILAKLYLENESPEKAYTLYKDLFISDKKEFDLVQLLNAASYSGIRELIGESNDLAIRFRPDLTTSNKEILKRIADNFLWTDQSSKAFPYYMNLIALEPSNANVSKLLDVAQYTNDNNFINDAIKKALETFPNNIELRLKAVNMYIAMNQSDKAFNAYQLIATEQKTSDNANKLLALAQATGKIENIKLAASLILKIRPNDYAIRLNIAELYVAIGDQETAIDYYRQYTALNPNDQKARLRLTQLYVWTNQPNKALDDKLDFAKNFDQGKAIFIDAAKTAEQLGQLDAAYKIYLRLYRNSPDDLTIYQEMMRLASWNNRVDQAVFDLAFVSDEFPNNYLMAINAANALFDSGKSDASIVYFERALSQKKDDIVLRKRLATYYGWLGRTKERTEQLAILSESDNLSIDERLELARVYLDKKEPAKVVRLFDNSKIKNSKLTPNDYILLANAYSMLGKTAMSLEIYHKLYKENPNDFALLIDIGNNALWINQPEFALKIFEYVLSKSPNNGQALKGSALLYVSKNEQQKAITRFETYFQLNPKDLEASYQLGELYDASKRYEMAWKKYQKTLKLLNQFDDNDS